MKKQRKYTAVALFSSQIFNNSKIVEKLNTRILPKYKLLTQPVGRKNWCCSIKFYVKWEKLFFITI